MIGVLHVDGDALARRGFQAILSSTEDIVLMAEAESGHEALGLADKRLVDTVVLELALPAQSGLDTLYMLRKRFRRLPILVLTQYPEALYGVRAIKRGATGYLTKDCSVERLTTAIRKCAAGARVVSPALTEELAMVLSSRALPHHGLTDRQFELLVLTAQGRTANEIGAKLCLSPATIRKTRQQMLVKLSAANSAEALRYLIEKISERSSAPSENGVLHMAAW